MDFYGQKLIHMIIWMISMIHFPWKNSNNFSHNLKSYLPKYLNLAWALLTILASMLYISKMSWKNKCNRTLHMVEARNKLVVRLSISENFQILKKLTPKFAKK